MEKEGIVMKDEERKEIKEELKKKIDEMTDEVLLFTEGLTVDGVGLVFLGKRDGLVDHSCGKQDKVYLIKGKFLFIHS